jgi:hypothetical protein
VNFIGLSLYFFFRFVEKFLQILFVHEIPCELFGSDGFVGDDSVVGDGICCKFSGVIFPVHVSVNVF